MIYLALDGVTAGFLALADTLRPASAGLIRKLQDLGIRPVLLTGDHVSAAHAIAAKLGIREVYAGCLPEDKLEHIGTYQKESGPICMIGDGINDAPALKKADVGIAMGGVDVYKRQVRYSVLQLQPGRRCDLVHPHALCQSGLADLFRHRTRRKRARHSLSGL